jgi:hypothetical protein
MKYHLIGGNPFRGYTGTLTYTGLNVVGTNLTMDEAKKLWDEKYEECGGLGLIVGEDGSTPEELYPGR